MRAIRNLYGGLQDPELAALQAEVDYWWLRQWTQNRLRTTLGIFPNFATWPVRISCKSQRGSSCSTYHPGEDANRGGSELLGSIIPDLDDVVATERSSLPTPANPVLPLHLRPTMLAAIAIGDLAGQGRFQRRHPRTPFGYVSFSWPQAARWVMK